MSKHANSAQQIRAGDRARTHSASAQRGRNGTTRRREAWSMPRAHATPVLSTYFPRARSAPTTN